MQNLLYRVEIFDVEPKVDFFNSIAQNKPLETYDLFLVFLTNLKTTTLYIVDKIEATPQK